MEGSYRQKLGYTHAGPTAGGSWLARLRPSRRDGFPYASDNEEEPGATVSKETITRFYEAFGKRDAETMAACYSDDVVFSDPVFPGLKGEEARDMWRLLCGRAKDLVVTPSNITDTTAHWDAHYAFGPARRQVINRIDATFVFNSAGKITQHTDRFDLWAWSRMAIGVPGMLLGWSPLLQNKIRQQANDGLVAYRAKK